MSIMANNLNAMIARSGMSKREVAALKGVTPETLSRQVHGKIQMTLADAERYAKILDCSAHDVMFPTPPTPIIGYSKLVGTGDDQNPIIETKISLNKTIGKVYLTSYMRETNGAIIWSAEDGYSGVWEHWRSAVEFIERRPIEKKIVSPAATQHMSYCLLAEPVEAAGIIRQLVCGILYPEPGGLYTIHNNETGTTLKGQKLIWAAACVGVVFRPELRGLEIVRNK